MKVHYEIYEGEELAKRIGTRYYKKALYTPGTLLVNPADVRAGCIPPCRKTWMYSRNAPSCVSRKAPAPA